MLELVRRRYILRNVILITVILIVLTWIPKSNGQVPQRKGDSQKQEATEERQTYESDKNVQVRNGRNKNGHTNSKVNEITSELTDTEIKGGDKTNDEEKEKEGKGKSEFRLETLVVSAGGNKEIQLPKNELTLSAFAVPADDKGEYKYEWTLVEHPTGGGEQVGHMEDINTANLKLSQLVAGLYTFKVAVSAEGKYGETLVNVTVKPPARINKAPEATITPTSQQVNQPNDVVLDGSQSKDDDKIVKYHWELVSGPLIDNSAQEANMDGPMLVLKGLSPGNYKFKLTVTDSDGATNSTFASVTVIKEVDYPPKANAGSNVIISLPQNSVTLYGNSSTDDKSIASYEWIKHEDHLTADMLLVAGLYTFKVAVSAEGKYGETLVNVTVKPPARINKAPEATITPTSQQVNQPNDVVLDGSQSKDDDKIVKYHWELVSGPLIDNSAQEANMDGPMLVLKGLSPGNYKFKLTVTDSDGATNSTFASVTVIKEVDYPPKANAGSNVIISLPQNSVTLYGNSSTDDKSIASYEWIKHEDHLTADMLGVRTQVLRLENLEVGDYTFTLKVTDTAGQTSTADVHVFVKPEHNKPPVAKVGKDVTIFLPRDTVILNGTNSTDDQKISSYKWNQVSGGKPVPIENSDRALATVSKLSVGEYKFKLTVTDEEGLQTSATMTVTVKENENHPPKANAGGDKIVTLPISLVTLDGRKSSDDRGIMSYLWTRDDKSLAVGDVLNNSDHQAVLQLTNLIAGRYFFTLEVEDEEGVKSSDTASVIVNPNIHAKDLLELHLDADIGSFTEANKKSVEDELALLIHRSNQEGETEVSIQRIYQGLTSNHLIATFYATTVTKENRVIETGLDVVEILKNKLRKNAGVVDFKVLQLDTVICQNNCSGHGHCDSTTKLCVCEAFWMENPFRFFLGDGESNCEWSVLYVIIISFISMIGFTGLIWGIACLFKRWFKLRPKKRHRYTLLDEDDDDDKHRVEMLPKGKMQNSSLMISESDFSSDEETLFINHKKTNGHVKNGFVKPGRSKVKT